MNWKLNLVKKIIVNMEKKIVYDSLITLTCWSLYLGK